MIMKNNSVGLPIVAEYDWTEDEYLESQNQYRKVQIRRPFLYLLYFVSGIISFLGILSLIEHSVSFSAIALTVVGLYFLILKRYEDIYLAKKRFRSNPSKNKHIRWQFQPDAVLVDVQEMSESSTSWAAFTKAIRTPKGILLYSNGNSIYHWLPNNAFEKPADLDKLWALMQEKNLKCHASKA